MGNIITSFKKTFMPSAEEAARRRAQFVQGVKGGFKSLGAAATSPQAAIFAPVMGVAGAGRVAATGAGRAAAAIKTAVSRATTSPFAGARSIADIGRVAAGRAAGVATTAIGGAAIQSALTGDPYRVALKKVGLGAVGFGVGGIPGAIVGGIGAGFSTAGKASKGFIDLFDRTPANMSIGEPYKRQPNLKDLIPEIPQPSFNVLFPSEIGGIGAPAGPSAVFAPSFSGGVGGIGGGGDFAQMLLLATLAGGAGGYLLGRRKRKRKRKKYKRGQRKK